MDTLWNDLRRSGRSTRLIIAPAPSGSGAAWISALLEAWVLRPSDPIAVSGMPDAPAFGGDETAALESCVDDMLAAGFFCAPGQQIWITEAGYASGRGQRAENEARRKQCHQLRKALAAPVARIYWSSLMDVAPAPAPGDWMHRGLVTSTMMRTPAFDELKMLLKSEDLMRMPALS
jgi:hypothetical protein